MFVLFLAGFDIMVYSGYTGFIMILWFLIRVFACFSADLFFVLVSIVFVCRVAFLPPFSLGPY